MSLPLQEIAMESDSSDLVRMTLMENGASSPLVDALIPVRPLQAGEQYRFHFDMTKCIGCRSCEIACNEQNGNPAEIKWRRVGELEGGVYPFTQRTYLSMGCNHCLSADCLKGCPVDAYSKDPITGIVLHSAEACIGCQYCVWNCPYSVPQFNAERGVVGKCDMCRGRLVEGREPACVNACPENAIQIEIVNKQEWRENYHAAESPGMPPASQTISTTRITLPQSGTDAWLNRVDTGAISLEHAHGSLIGMTTAMQAAFGALAVLCTSRVINPFTLTFLLGLTTVALSISVLHLGRPAFAWRAVKMWRRSWLSREVLLFGLFYGSVFGSTACAWIAPLRFLMFPLAWTGVFLGLLGTIASSYIYLVKSRPGWNMVHTPLDFLFSSALLGSALAGTLKELSSTLEAHGVRAQVAIPAQSRLVAIAASLWVLNQIVKIVRLRSASLFEERACYNLLRSERLMWCVALSFLSAGAAVLFTIAPLPWIALLMAICSVVIGRYLFFVSVVPLSMGLTFLSKKHGGVAV